MDEARVKEIALFASLNRKESRALAQRTDEVDLPQGRVLVNEGDWPYEFFAIVEGTASVTRGEQFLAELGPGDFFGEMGLVGDTRRNATVTAKSPIKVVVMTAQAFRQTARELPAVAEKIRAAIDERCRHLEPIS